MTSMDAPLLITTPTNIQYLTGFLGALPDEREAFCLLTQDCIYLFTNILYLEEANELKVKSEKLKIIEISRENPLSKELKKIMEELQKDWIPGQARNDKGTGIRDDKKTTGQDDKKNNSNDSRVVLEFEEDNLTVAEFKKLKKELKGITLKATRGKVSDMRLIKSDDEIENIRKACMLTDACFTYILPFLKVGVPENEIAWEMESFIRKKGGQLAFAPIVAFGVNSSKPHYSGTGDKGPASPAGRQETRLQENDIILLDFGAKVNGYCADMTRVVFVGQPKDEWTKAYDTVLAAQEGALSMMRRGAEETKIRGKTISGAKLDAEAKKVISDAGLPAYPHSLGHGLGLDIHEAPRLSIKKDAELKPRMVVTVEPGIYIEGQFGIRIEDTVLLTENGIDALTQSSKDIRIV